MTVRTAPVRPHRMRGFAVLGAVAAGVLLVAGCGASAGEDDRPETRSFPLAGRTLTVDSDDSVLELVAADGDQVRVTRWFSGKTVLGEDPKVSWRMDGDTLRLRVDCDGFISDCAARHRIEVPRAVAVRVANKDGRVTASGFRTALRISSDDGRVTVRDSDGPLELHSKDGAIEASGVGSQRVEARSQDGRVRLDLISVPDRVVAHSKDGAISVRLPKATYKVSAGSADGSVEVDVPRDANSAHEVDVRSEDGRVRVGRNDG